MIWLSQLIDNGSGAKLIWWVHIHLSQQKQIEHRQLRLHLVFSTSPRSASQSLSEQPRYRAERRLSMIPLPVHFRVSVRPMSREVHHPLILRLGTVTIDHVVPSAPGLGSAQGEISIPADWKIIQKTDKGVRRIHFSSMLGSIFIRSLLAFSCGDNNFHSFFWLEPGSDDQSLCSIWLNFYAGFHDISVFNKVVHEPTHTLIWATDCSCSFLSRSFWFLSYSRIILREASSGIQFHRFISEILLLAFGYHSQHSLMRGVEPVKRDFFKHEFTLFVPFS